MFWIIINEPNFSKLGIWIFSVIRWMNSFLVHVNPRGIFYIIFVISSKNYLQSNEEILKNWYFSDFPYWKLSSWITIPLGQICDSSFKYSIIWIFIILLYVLKSAEFYSHIELFHKNVFTQISFFTSCCLFLTVESRNIEN